MNSISVPLSNLSRKIIFYSVLLVLSASLAHAAIIPSANTNGSSVNKPLGTSKSFIRTQSLYLGSEVGQGYVYKIKYFVNAVSSPGNVSVTVKMKMTNATTVASSSLSTATSSTSTVFTGTIASSAFVVNNWVEILLSTPFNTNNVSNPNLLVLIETNNGNVNGNESSTGKGFRWSSHVNGNMSQTWESNTISAPLGTAVGTLIAHRPNITTEFSCNLISNAGTSTISSSQVCNTGVTVNLGLTGTFDSGDRIVYQWKKLVNGITSIIANSATPNITYTPNSIGFERVYCQVTCSNSSNSKSTAHLPLTIGVEAPSVIFGDETPCRGTDQLYSVSTPSGTSPSYEWTLPLGNGWSGSSTDDNILVTVGTAPGPIAVRAQIGSCFSSITSLAVTPKTVPNQPSGILVSVSLLSGGTANLSVVSVPGLVYTWVLPSDWTITNGWGTSAIEVLVGAASGNVSVFAENDCGLSIPQTVSLQVVSSSLAAVDMRSSDCGRLNYSFANEGILNSYVMLQTAIKATRYEIEFYKDVNLTSSIFYYQKFQSILTVVFRTSDLSFLNWGETYYVRARAVQGTAVGPWGNVCQIGFVANPALGVSSSSIDISDCKKGVMNPATLLTATEVSGANAYKFSFYTNSTMSDLPYATIVSNARNLRVSKVVPSLIPCTQYWIGVQAIIVAYTGNMNGSCLMKMKCVVPREAEIENSQIQIYPNPFSNNAQVNVTSSLNEQTKLEIRDALGRLIEVETIQTNTPTIIGNNIPVGVYIANAVLSSGESVFIKFIKSN